MKQKIMLIAATAITIMLALVITFGPAAEGLKNPAPPVLASPTLPVKTGESVVKNDKAEIDLSNASEGFVMVKWLAGGDKRVKVQIKRGDSTTYTYDLRTDGEFETFPFSDGGGEYTVRVFQNVEGTKYSQAQHTTVKVELRDEFLPFLYSNQYVNWTRESEAAKKAAEITSGCDTELDKVKAVFDYVTENVEYDYEFAEMVSNTNLSGYIPDVDSTLESGRGICLDYAALMTAQLRSLNIPAKLVVGWAGEVYHAWVNVYTEENGWMDGLIYFDGTNWTLMDPTFTANADGDEGILQYISDGGNYTERYAY